MRNFIFGLVLFLGGYVFGAPLDSVRMESKNGKNYIVHRIEKGETFYRLSQRYNASVERIRSANNGLATLSIGQEVLVPTTAKMPSGGAGAATQNENRYHTVAKGQTLYAVSRLYNVSVANIKEWNNMSSNSLSVGQRIIIGKGMPVAKTESTSVGKERATPAREERSTAEKVEVSTEKIKKRSYKPQQQQGVVSLGDHTKLNHKFSYCVHTSAPIGTIIILTCKVNDRVILVKVVDNQPMPEGVIMQVNKTVFNSLSIDSETFDAEISYLD